MGTLLILAVIVVWWLVVAVAKGMHTDARYRWEDRVMADYLEAEEARYHQQRLTAIDTAVKTTEEELDRIAAEASGQVIEGTAVELVRP